MKRREGNYKRGQDHPRAVADDHDVRLAIELCEVYGLSSRVVAEKFGVSPSCVRRWRSASRRV